MKSQLGQIHLTVCYKEIPSTSVWQMLSSEMNQTGGNVTIVMLEVGHLQLYTNVRYAALYR